MEYKISTIEDIEILEILNRKHRLEFTDECQEQFNELKKIFSSSGKHKPVLLLLES